MDHDRLFKELLSTFFLEFVELFMPSVMEYLDHEFAVVPLDKEIFTDIALGEIHEVDLVTKVKFRGLEAFFLMHVENQSDRKPAFAKRMFRYFSRLSEKYDLPVYPAALLSYDTPFNAEPDNYTVAFSDKTVLRFEYTVIQLNRLSWRDFIHRDNPVASALMAKMSVAAEDRGKVRLECLRMLARLRLNPAKARVIGVFIETYLQLSAGEMKQYERAVSALEMPEKESIMELMTSWERKGLEQGLVQGLEQGLVQGLEQGLEQGLVQGRQEGKEELLAILLEQRFSTLPADITERLDNLTSDRLNELGKMLFSLSSLEELEEWLTRVG